MASEAARDLVTRVITGSVAPPTVFCIDNLNVIPQTQRASLMPAALITVITGSVAPPTVFCIDNLNVIPQTQRASLMPAALITDYNRLQRRTMNGHSCAACKSSKGLCVQHHSNGTKSSAKGLPAIGSLCISAETPKRTRSKPSDSTPGRHADKNRHKTGNALVSRSLLSFSEPSVSTLQARCRRLEQDNATLLKTITEMEDESMKSATQYLLQYDRAGSNVLAVQLWADRQVQDARQDMEKVRAEGQERLTALRGQLEACEEKLQVVKEELQQLREYRDRGHSVAVLQAAHLERDLRILNETHQDQAADVEALAQTELHKLLGDRQAVMEEALQAVVEQHMECLPLSLKRMCLQNREMKQDIQAYQQMVAELQEEVSHLQESGESLCKSWKEENEKRCRNLLLGRPSCSPDEDVVLNVPRSKQMPI